MEREGIRTEQLDPESALVAVPLPTPGGIRHLALAKIEADSGLADSELDGYAGLAEGLGMQMRVAHAVTGVREKH